MFSKRPSNLSKDDLIAFLAEEFQEGQTLELKETIPSKDGQDSWTLGKGAIGNYGRDRLLSELVAFANSEGGWLLLGVSETKGKPPRAAELKGVPKAAELAERIRHQCRDCVEPQIQIIESAGVPIDDLGNGVVVINVPSSPFGPHRLRTTKECYIRRADRTEAMTMREIQDLTLHLDRGLQRLDGVLAGLPQEFEGHCRRHWREADSALGIRISALPIGRSSVPRVFGVPEIQPPLVTVYRLGEHSRDQSLSVPRRNLSWRPIIRGTAGEFQDERLQINIKLQCDGLVQYELNIAKVDEHPVRLYPSWILSLLVNSLCAVEKYRTTTGSLASEFAMEVHIHTQGIVPVSTLVPDQFDGQRGPIPSNSVLFPRYSVGVRDEFTDLVNLFYQDFWDAVGSPSEFEMLKLDLNRALRDSGANTRV